MGSKQGFVDFIRDELSKRNWAHAELARRSGISQAHISRVINSNYQPGIEFLNSIASCMNLSKEYIYKLAGLLSENPKSNVIIEEIHQILESLSNEDQKLVLGFINLLKDR